jgi:hypothetical protein
MAAPALLLLSLACALAPACRRPSSAAPDAGGADALVPALNSFTEELLAKVESAQDRKAGLAEAQRLLDARKAELAGRIAEFKRGAGERRGGWLEVEVDNTDRVHRLQLEYADEAARDPDFKARLERLVSDYDSLFGGR